jgi:hypothetical protein
MRSFAWLCRLISFTIRAEQIMVETSTHDSYRQGTTTTTTYQDERPAQNTRITTTTATVVTDALTANAQAQPCPEVGRNGARLVNMKLTHVGVEPADL